MHHIIPNPKCSKCGSDNSETFQQHGKRGRRCLSCGHEIIIEDNNEQNYTKSKVYVYRKEQELF